MAITYDWIFNPLIVKPMDESLTDVVVLVDWRRTATDGTYHAQCYGQITLGPPNPAAYTPFADLTKAQVTQWVEATIGPDQMAQFDQSLAGDIERQKNPPVIPMAPPWESHA